MSNKRGFTLIELLVVIAIIALLLSIVMPGLNMAKKKAASAVCLVNSKNLGLAWYMYQEENNGRIASAEMEAKEPGKSTIVGWIGQPREADGTIIPDSQMTRMAPPVTDEDEIRGIVKGAIYPYIEDPGVYHCPADKVRKSLFDGSKIYTTYQVPGYLYGFMGSNKQIQKFSEIRLPGTRYAFVESAEMRNWNKRGRFLMAAPEYGFAEWGWWVPLAINHGDSSILGFCDGHAEVRKWRNKSTRDHVDKLIREGGRLYGQSYPTDGREDLEYMIRGWAYRYKGQ